MKDLIKRGSAVLAENYARLPLVMESGKGSYLVDADGKEYLDFLSGIAVCSLGHSSELLNQALLEQSEKLWHASNLYWLKPQIELAEQLINEFGPGKAFFCNSGTEANEAAIKLARKWGQGRYEIIAFKNSFHGRTLGSLSATGQEKYQKAFRPLIEGFVFAEFNDIDSVRALVNERSVAVMLEVIQGEGGLNEAESEFLNALSELCQENNLLMIIDEVQTGIGRTGLPFGYQHYGLEPDIITLAKGLGGGFPIGALLATTEVVASFQPGDHAATFGGNPLATAVASAALGEIFRPEFLAAVREKGEYLREFFSELAAENTLIKKVKGRGLMFGCELNTEAAPIVAACLAEGLILNAVGGTTLRMVPPLTISKEELQKGFEIVKKALSAIR